MGEVITPRISSSYLMPSIGLGKVIIENTVIYEKGILCGTDSITLKQKMPLHCNICLSDGEASVSKTTCNRRLHFF